MKKFFLFVLVIFVVVFPMQLAIAVEPDEILKDPVLEERARNISSRLRCPVCQSQSLDDSNALLARDLRFLIRERLKAGDSNQQVIDFLVERYGEFILLKPPFNKVTWFLWLSPLIVMIIGLSTIFFRISQYKCKKIIALNADKRNA
ncbi:cytochrome c-type biogenesis protein [Bartonella sp. A05]|uniref:cytochrome c-type biogenesis protein n=1 Tax=Bartonella sp. A05 TaxID=2967261 RepID=UPI0022A9B4D8|nr:cytochrome c-type biogenesis protein [Bartonella sp. A05]MCZ2203846.1 cytochrome c-type biogenesis protein CcmH [Bartonella sp. A05]